LRRVSADANPAPPGPARAAIAAEIRWHRGCSGADAQSDKNARKPGERAVKSIETKVETGETPDGLAKRMFVLTMIGVVAYIGVVITLISSAD
jgi:hypothetical protein